MSISKKSSRKRKHKLLVESLLEVGFKPDASEEIARELRVALNKRNLFVSWVPSLDRGYPVFAPSE